MNLPPYRRSFLIRASRRLRCVGPNNLVCEIGKGFMRIEIRRMARGRERAFDCVAQKVDGESIASHFATKKVGVGLTIDFDCLSRASVLLEQHVNPIV